MPINLNAPLSSLNANNTFLDKTIPNTMAATLTLADTDLVSGSAIGNAQLSINRNTSVAFSEVTKNNGDTITVDSIFKIQEHSVIGDAAPAELNALPFGAAQSVITGTIIYVLGGDDTNTVKLVDNRLVDFGCVLNGSATLGLYDMLTLKFNLEKKRYIEIGRNF